MIELLDPRLARDLRVCMPHVGATQDATECHHCHEMAGQCWDAAATVRHHPKLWKHRNGTDEEATHPKGVEEGAVIEVAMEQAGKDERPHRERGCWKNVLFNI